MVHRDVALILVLHAFDSRALAGAFATMDKDLQLLPHYEAQALTLTWDWHHVYVRTRICLRRLTTLCGPHGLIATRTTFHFSQTCPCTRCNVEHVWMFGCVSV